MPIPTQSEIEAKLRGEDLDEWPDLWRAEQGPAKTGGLKVIAKRRKRIGALILARDRHVTSTKTGGPILGPPS